MYTETCRFQGIRHMYSNSTHSGWYLSRGRSPCTCELSGLVLSTALGPFGGGLQVRTPYPCGLASGSFTVLSVIECPSRLNWDCCSVAYGAPRIGTPSLAAPGSFTIVVDPWGWWTMYSGSRNCHSL